MASIEFEHVTKSYKDRFEANRDMSLADGESDWWVGWSLASGAGWKTSDGD